MGELLDVEQGDVLRVVDVADLTAVPDLEKLPFEEAQVMRADNTHVWARVGGALSRWDRRELTADRKGRPLVRKTEGWFIG